MHTAEKKKSYEGYRHPGDKKAKLDPAREFLRSAAILHPKTIESSSPKIVEFLQKKFPSLFGDLSKQTSPEGLKSVVDAYNDKMKSALLLFVPHPSQVNVPQWTVTSPTTGRMFGKTDTGWIMSFREPDFLGELHAIIFGPGTAITSFTQEEARALLLKMTDEQVSNAVEHALVFEARQSFNQKMPHALRQAHLDLVKLQKKRVPPSAVALNKAESIVKDTKRKEIERFVSQRKEELFKKE